MKICFLCLNLDTIGGIQKVIASILDNIAEKNDIEIIMPFGNSVKKNLFDLPPSVHISDFDKFPQHNKKNINGFCSLALIRTNTKFGYLDNTVGKRIAEKIIFKEELLSEITKYINDLDPDVVIGVGAIFSLLIAMIAPELKAKTVAWEHNTFESYFSTKGRDGYGLTRLFKEKYSNLDAIFVLTESDKNKFSNAFNTPVFTLYNPVCFSEENVHIPNTDSPAVFVGRLLVEQKGLDYLVEIVKKICAYKPNFKINIVGDGADRNRLEHLIESNNLKNHMSCIGATTDVDKYYSNSSIFLHTSRYEGFGVVLVEAMSHGLPVVAFHNNGPDEIISNNVNGFLIDQYDTDAFAKKVLELLDDKLLYDRISNAARRRAKDFSSEKIAHKFMNLLEEVNHNVETKSV